jgi:hypothetical protein
MYSGREMSTALFIREAVNCDQFSSAGSWILATQPGFHDEAYSMNDLS